MAANLYRGEVEFTLPMAPDGSEPGPTYLLKIGINEFIGVQTALTDLSGVHHLRLLMHTALTASLPDQAHLTITDAGDFIDLLGIEETNALMAKTRWGIHTDRAMEKAKAAIEDQQKRQRGPCPQCGYDPSVPKPVDEAQRRADDVARYVKPNGAGEDPMPAGITSSAS